MSSFQPPRHHTDLKRTLEDTLGQVVPEPLVGFQPTCVSTEHQRFLGRFPISRGTTATSNPPPRRSCCVAVPTHIHIRLFLSASATLRWKAMAMRMQTSRVKSIPNTHQGMHVPNVPQQDYEVGHREQNLHSTEPQQYLQRVPHHPRQQITILFLKLTQTVSNLEFLVAVNQRIAILVLRSLAVKAEIVNE